MGPRERTRVGEPRSPRFADALRHRSFAVVYAAETQSTIGDQLARVALSFLVFERTGSAPATALTYAATYLPAVLGGSVLAGIGDRFSRKSVMIGCDLVRGSLFAIMGLADLNVLALVALLVLAVFLGPAFSASEVSYLAAVLDQETFRVGTGLRMITSQAAQVVGFAVGGAAVETLGPRSALVCDAATFLLSALLVASLLPPGPTSRGASRSDTMRPRRSAWLWQESPVRALIMLSALAGLFIVPEGLAVPYGDASGASDVEVGVMLAAIPLGGVVGVLLLVRRVPARHRRAAMSGMAIACGVPLVVSGVAQHWPVAVACWLLSGALAAYQVEAMTRLVRLIPDAVRARVIGAASSVLLGAQGLGLVVFAGVAGIATPAHAIALAGLAGSVFAVLLVLGPLRTVPEDRTPRDSQALG